MVEQMISPVSQGLPDHGAPVVSQASQGTQESQGVFAAKLNSSQNENVSKRQPEHRGYESGNKSPAPAFADIRLKFQVDAKTNDVTVFVIDKTSHQVIRTIPQDELKKLKQGELVSLFT